MDEQTRSGPAETPTLGYVKVAIEQLASRNDRARLRVWMLATYDENGDLHRRIHNDELPS
jgi:hypothetical protein